MLKQGADITRKDLSGKTPIENAIYQLECYFLVIPYLKNKSWKNKDGKTCLDIAIENRQFKVATHLIKPSKFELLLSKNFKNQILIEFFINRLCNSYTLDKNKKAQEEPFLLKLCEWYEGHTEVFKQKDESSETLLY